MFFDKKLFQYGEDYPTLWLVGAALITAAYLVFGLTFIKIDYVSVYGFYFAVTGLIWLIIGVLTKEAKIPKILFLPAAFLVMTLFSSTFLDPYPREQVLEIFTVWTGALTVALFIANGVSLNLVLAGFIIFLIANLISIWMGYDVALIRRENLDWVTVPHSEINRYSGLVGQQNMLLSMVLTLPNLLFLRRKQIHPATFLTLLVIAVGVTFLTGSRSGILFSILLVVTGWIWLLRTSGTSTLLFLLCFGIFSSGITYSFLNPNMLATFENSDVGQLHIVERTIEALDGDDDSTRQRTELITGYWDLMYTKPMFGHGPDMFKEVSGTGLYAHNNLVELVTNYGILGLLIYYAMYLAIAIRILRSNIGYASYSAPLLFLAVADIWYVTHLSRAMILLLCILLIKCFPLEPILLKKKKRRSYRKSRRTIKFSW